jgi:ParB family transcriptional regulator, chromosome partitioning protein
MNVENLDVAIETIKNVPWTELQEVKVDPELLKKLEAAEALLKSLRQAVTPTS